MSDAIMNGQGAGLTVGLLPADILLIDDTPENIRAAQACGWEVVLWTGDESLSNVPNGHFPTKFAADEFQKPGE